MYLLAWRLEKANITIKLIQHSWSLPKWSYNRAIYGILFNWLYQQLLIFRLQSSHRFQFISIVPLINFLLSPLSFFLINLQATVLFYLVFKTRIGQSFNVAIMFILSQFSIHKLVALKKKIIGPLIFCFVLIFRL